MVGSTLETSFTTLASCIYILKPDLFQAAPQDGSTLGTVVTTSAGERKSPTGLMLKQNANHDILQPTWPLYTVKKNRTLL